MNDKKPLLIHSESMHASHKMLTDYIGADMEPVYTREVGGMNRVLHAISRSRQYPDYPVYLLEGGTPMLPCRMKKFFSLRDNTKMIGILADATMVNQVERLEQLTGIETVFHKMGKGCLDGGIAVSPFIKHYADKVLDVPVEVARPPMPQERYNDFGKVKPDLGSNVIVSVGKARHDIGMDILVEQFNYAKEKVPELELWIIGKGHPKEYEKYDGVKVKGYVEDLAEVFEQASLFVHAGRCSPYPIATLEAMRAGIPVVVSDMTGTKEIVENVEKKIRQELNQSYNNYFVRSPHYLARGIVAYYLGGNGEEKELLSKKFRRESEYFEPKKRCEHFKDTFDDLVDRIE